MFSGVFPQLAVQFLLALSVLSAVTGLTGFSIPFLLAQPSYSSLKAPLFLGQLEKGQFQVAPRPGVLVVAGLVVGLSGRTEWTD